MQKWLEMLWWMLAQLENTIIVSVELVMSLHCYSFSELVFIQITIL